ncbi:complement factor H-related protein 1-like isoform X2 [Gadus macrocephalus]|uniref:complement factor H-related protein 1-like isoform X2 n=1 Tax=Gadus macrocephalus TaxID=80720 RepID=UPI0028CB498E|nr:complement factor H-related protein 1-like isoform X2 [Gadus macrocephalus]
MATCTENGWTPNPLCKANGAELEKVEPTVVSGSSATTTAANGAELEKVEPTVVSGSSATTTAANGAELEKVEPTVVSGSSATTTADSGSEITCGDPPSLPDGAIHGHFKAPHKHGVKVKYSCGINFTIEGDVKTCENGQWTGETRCLDNGAKPEKVEPTVVPGSSATTTAGPCTVGREQLRTHHFKFLRSLKELYFVHDEKLTFVCEDGFVHVPPRITMVCVNREIDLPTCTGI